MDLIEARKTTDKLAFLESELTTLFLKTTNPDVFFQLCKERLKQAQIQQRNIRDNLNAQSKKTARY